MARPKFHVQHFVACLNAGWQGVPGPRTYRDLEGVTYKYFVPPGSEMPQFEEFWFYARLFLANDTDGFRDFSVDLHWLDAPGGPRLVGRTISHGRVRFRRSEPVVNATWVVRPLVFPSLGSYEYQLRCATRTILGIGHRTVAREYVRIES